MPSGTPPSPRKRVPLRVADLRGAVRLVVDGIHGVTHIAEGLHGNIARLAPPLGAAPERPTRGITGFVYRAVRSGSGWVGAGLDAALAGVEGLLPDAGADPDEAPQRQVLLAALNGVVGDHLARSGNPLAIPMALQVRGPARPRLLLFIHGLCMSDRQWARKGRDQATSLARALDRTPVYLRYNSGRHVSETGAELAAKLQELVDRWPVPLEDITIVGHSMGGLVARSALHQAMLAGMEWTAQVRQIVFLGTPHQGAPLERAGNWLHTVLGLSPYLAPFTRLGRMRSDGITDLRHGNLLRSDWEGGRYLHRDTRTVVPLPPHVACYAVAGTLERQPAAAPPGDGLVPVDSALGRHARPTHDLHLGASHTWIARGVHHLDLLNHPAVWRKLRRWLA